MKKVNVVLAAFVFLIVGVVCAENQDTTKKETEVKPEIKMKLTCEAFKEGEFIPAKYSCEGADVSPALIISDVPDKANSLALICDDPDAPVGLWVHWVAYNIPPATKVLPEGFLTSIKATLGEDSSVTIIQGINSWGKFGYGGPCPPPGNPHRYFFKLYAIDIVLGLEEKTMKDGVTADKLIELMKGHILAEFSLMGKYKR